MKTYLLLFLFVALFSCSDKNSTKSVLKIVNDLTIQGLKGHIKSVAEYDYKLDERSGILDKSLVSKTIHLFSDNGNEQETILYNGDGRINTDEKFSYNQLGQKKEMRKVNASDSLLERTIYYYNAINRDTENISYNSSDALEGKESYKYDEKGNRIEEAHNFPEPKRNYKIVSVFDGSNNAVEERFYDSYDTLVSLFKQQYDATGNLTGTKYYDHGTLVDERTKFENYDKEKNWLKETIFLKDKPVNTVERTIEYY